MQNELCNQCFLKDQCKIECPALLALNQICKIQLIEQKTALISKFAQEIGLIKYEIDNDLEQLGNKILDHFPEFDLIRNSGVKIGYLKSYDKKQSNGKSTLAECRIVKGLWTAYLPFDFIITFFWPNIHGLSDNQLQLVMYHELRHIGLNHKGYYLVPHDIEDFASILSKYGLDWNHLNSDVPDILESVKE